MTSSQQLRPIPRSLPAGITAGTVVTALVLGLLLAATVAAGNADPAAGTPTRYERGGDGEIGEASAIRARARNYLLRHGRNGTLSAADMLRRTSHGYKRWLARSRHAIEKGIEGAGWISLGPTNGAGRCSAVAPHPTEHGTVLAGAAGGGVWRTRDSGLTWYPLTDGMADLSVGALAYAPSDPNVVYLGTGEGGLAIDFIPGIGLLRSDDGGDTWYVPGDPTDILASQFFALSIHPEDPDSLLAATNKGLFRSSDGGLSWQPRLCDPGLIGVTEVQRASSDPDLVIAALWCKGLCPDGIARIMRSHDGGVTWMTAADGLPPTREIKTDINRSSLTITPSDDRILYLGLSDLNDDGVGVSRIFRSNNHGRTWQETAYEGNYLWAQGWYNNTMTVNPHDPQVVIAGGVSYEISLDGGDTWRAVDPYESVGGMGNDTIPHVDGHDLQWQGDTLWLACDGGIWMSPDNGATWSARNNGLVTRQYYGLSLDPMDTNRVLAGSQDNETNLRWGSGTDSWVNVIGDDGFECAINPLIPQIMYGTKYATIVYRNMNHGVGEWLEISPPKGAGMAPFITPLLMRRDTPWVLYTGATTVWRSDDAGDHWRELPTAMLDGTWTPRVINAIAITPADPRVLLVAKEEIVYGSRNGGETWRQLVSFGTRVNNLEISPFDADAAIACLAQNDPGAPQLMLTTDGGETWQAAEGIPSFPVQVARWDPTDSSVIYAGTDLGLYRSSDAGRTWSEFGDGLPAASVHDLRILPDGSKLAVASHGRGIWELDIPASANSRPSITITSPADGTQVALGDSIPFVAEAVDSDGDELTVTWILDQPWQAVAGGGGTGTVTSAMNHTYDWRDSHLVAAHVEDGRGGSASATIRLDALEPADHCDTRKVVPAAGPFPYHLVTENWHASTADSDPVPPCVDTTSDETSGRWGSLWFEMTPAQTNTYTISTCGSAQDTVLSVWTGDPCGPYATTYSCNDDDERQHCWWGDRTNSHLEVELQAATTYRFMVGAWGSKWRGRIELHVDCPTCANQAPGYRYLVPAAAHATGSNDTTWVTDLDLFNPAGMPVATEISFRLEGGTGGSPLTIPVTIPSGTVLELPDVIMTLLGSAGTGAVDIMAEQELSITSRTSNLSDEGVFGQSIPSEPDSAALAPGESLRLIGLASGDDLRSNIGMLNLDPDAAGLAIELLDDQGHVLTTMNEELPAYGWRQRNRVLAGVRGAGLAAASAVVTNTSATARLLVYASVVDEHTGDPSYLRRADEATPGSPLWIPVVAHTAGVGTAAWRSDLVLTNTGQVDLSATVELLGAGSGELPSFEVPLAAGVSTLLPDVLDSRLAISGAGALRITIDAGLLQATSRTYTASGDGSYGQAIPGVRLERAVQLGESALLMQLRNDWDYRTNIGLVNPTDRQLLITAETFDTAGELLGTEVYTLPPHSWRQDNGAVPRGTSYAVLSSTTIGSRFFAYASVVNNRSDDPVYKPAVRQ